MKFPSIKDIASQTVISVDMNCLVCDALDIMLEQNHRNVIVLDADCFRVLTVIDVLAIQKKHGSLDIPLSKVSLGKVPTIDKNKNVLDTLEYLSDSMEYLCALNEDNTLFGLVTQTDITSNIDPDTLMDNYRLSDFLKQGRRMKWVNKGVITSVLLSEMLAASFDNVIIVDEMRPIGILTTKDIMNLIQKKSDLELSVEAYMSSPVDTIHKDSSIKQALDHVKSKYHKRVVVIGDEGKLTGVIAQKELISLTYSRWAILMKKYQEELSEINHILENKNREYETLASTDSLTGLYNRHKFSELYLSAYTTMTQRHNDMSMMLLDIDFFKSVNDNHGHNTGDQVLIQIAHSLLKTLRNIDIICRWGGEEFLILLPTANLDNTISLADNLRKYIEKLDLDIVGSVTVSIGVAQVKEGEDMNSVIGRADKALYLAKNSGRNCVKTQRDI